MSECGSFRKLHESNVGSLGYCYGCERFHLRLNGLLSFLTENQLKTVETNLTNMQRDLERNYDLTDRSAGVQIKLSKYSFLCLSYAEVREALEMIQMAKYMKDVNDLMEA